jgi:hypothetical protein
MTAVEAAPTGLKIYFVGHSFHMFIIRPLISLAKEAGIKGHWAEGWDMIGGSTPMQHWERKRETLGEGSDGGDNEVKAAIRAGGLDVLTLASNVIVPEPAIDLFADLAVEHNPGVRVMVQHSWGDAATSAIMLARHGRAPEAAHVPSNEDRDLVSADDLVQMRASMATAVGRLREQLESIDTRHGRAVTRLVPAGDTVMRLRSAVVAGDVPGVKRQSELFRDPLGHASQPTMDAVSYAWFAALYEQSPIGLTSLRDPDDADSAARQQVLQELAWDAVRDEPLALVGRPASTA